MTTTYEYENIKIELQEDIEEFLAGRLIQKVKDEDLDAGEVIVLDDETADILVADYIKDSVWAFNPDFLSSMTEIDEEVFKALQDKCEGSNHAVLSLIDKTCGIESFVKEAISADGRGHFLSGYDGEENDISVDGTIYYVYRVN